MQALHIGHGYYRYNGIFFYGMESYVLHEGDSWFLVRDRGFRLCWNQQICPYQQER